METNEGADRHVFSIGPKSGHVISQLGLLMTTGSTTQPFFFSVNDYDWKLTLPFRGGQKKKKFVTLLWHNWKVRQLYCSLSYGIYACIC